MHRIITTGSIPGDLRQKVSAAADAGFDGIELLDSDLVSYDRHPSDVRRMLTDLGLSIASLQPFQDFEALPGERRQKALARAERKFDLMTELGAELLIVTSNTSAQTLADRSRAIDDLRDLADRAAARQLRIGYEPLPWARHITRYADAWDIVQGVDRPNVGLVLDAFTLLHEADWAQTLARMNPARLMLVQLADSPGLTMEARALSQHMRCLPGQGKLPLRELLDRLATLGYDGAVSLEVSNDDFRSAAPGQIATDAQRSLRWLDDRNHTGPPVGALVTGIEFIEFASQGREANWLAHTIESLGFRKTHAHRSKAVALYRQGDVNLLINSEPDSLAHAHFATHGTSVCALGLRTPDPAALLAHSLRYGCQPFEGRVAPGELSIPTIRGVGGALIHFVPRANDGARFFDVDFQRLDEEAEPAGFGLRRIDHLALAVAPEEFLSTVLFHRTVLGFEPATAQDLADMHGIVHSRIVESPDRTVRIPINASHAPQTSTQRFRTRFAGSGVQHIAMACEDIFAVAARMNPFHILPMTPGYYAELETTFGLEKPLLEAMAEFNILYDEDERGHYFQLYTRQTRGVFFEIVQRHTYEGFGERNAPARLASQAREFEHIEDLLLNYEDPTDIP